MCKVKTIKGLQEEASIGKDLEEIARTSKKWQRNAK